MPPINLPVGSPIWPWTLSDKDFEALVGPLSNDSILAEILILRRPSIQTVHRGMDDRGDRRPAEAQDEAPATVEEKGA